MRVVVDIPDEYYRALKNCRDDTLLADSLLIKYGEPLFDVISKLPLQGMTENEMALMLASVAVDMQDKDVDDVLNKIRADVINIADGRRSIPVRSVINILDKYKAESKEEK